MLVNGKEIAEKILQEVKSKIGDKELNIAAVLVGEDESLKKFVDLKKKAAEKIGVGFRIHQFPADISNNELRKKLNDIVKAKTINGVIIELPLPKHLNTQYLLNAIPEEKDVDVLSQKSQGAFFAGRSKILPPAVETVKQILDFYNIGAKPRSRNSESFQENAAEPPSEFSLRGKRAAIFGYGLLVGRQASHWLMNQGATVTVINEYTPNPEKFSQEADIIISGVGKPNLVTADMIKDGAVVIDFGGDVDFDNVSKKAGLITPHIGGVGPIVVAAVFKNLVELATNL